MALTLEDIDRIVSRPNRLKGPGDEGFVLSASEEKSLDSAWAETAKSRGIKRRSSMSPEEIREHYERSK